MELRFMNFESLQFTVPGRLSQPKNLRTLNLDICVHDYDEVVLKAIDRSTSLVSWSGSGFSTVWHLERLPRAASTLQKTTFVFSTDVLALAIVSGPSLRELRVHIEPNEEGGVAISKPTYWRNLAKFSSLSKLSIHPMIARSLFSAQYLDAINEMPRGLCLSHYRPLFDLDPADYDTVRATIEASPIAEIVFDFDGEMDCVGWSNGSEWNDLWIGMAKVDFVSEPCPFS